MYFQIFFLIFRYFFDIFLLFEYKKIKINIGKTKSFQVNPKNEKDLTVEILEHQGENKGGETLLDRQDIVKIKKKNEDDHQNTKNEMQLKEAENKKNPEFDHERNYLYLISINWDFMQN